MPLSSRRRFFVPLLLLYVCGALPSLAAQGNPDAVYLAKRQKAAELFAQGKRLEALPLLEDLIRTNPRDDEMLVALAASLVDHAATVPDEEAAGKERFRARELLDKAWNLGNTTPLAMNLLQLLRQLPASGAIKFSENPQVEQAIHAGEAAFSARDFDSALKHYARALEMDPANYSAALFTGNTYDRKNDFAKAGVWYDRAARLAPNVESAFRYYADMLAREGNMRKARAMLIHAAVAEPYNRIVWRELHAWATLNNTQINEVYIGLPAEQKVQNPSSADLQSAEVSSVAQAYRDGKANWQAGSEFKKHFPGEKEYRHSLPEEAEALTAAAVVLEKLNAEKKIAELVMTDQSLGLLLKLHQARLIEAYVLFSLGDTGIARDYAAYRDKNRERLEEYMDKFVVPAAPVGK